MTEELLLKQRIRRKVNNNSVTKKYEKTKKGFIMRAYRNMKSRINGVQYLKSHLYLGKELIDKESFYCFSINDSEFNKLFDNWVSFNYDRKLSPSVDREKSSLGYIVNNIRWITHSENSRLGAISRWSNVNTVPVNPLITERIYNETEVR